MLNAQVTQDTEQPLMRIRQGGVLETVKSQTRGGSRAGVCDSASGGWNPSAGRKWFGQLSIDGRVVP